MNFFEKFLDIDATVEDVPHVEQSLVLIVSLNLYAKYFFSLLLDNFEFKIKNNEYIFLLELRVLLQLKYLSIPRHQKHNVLQVVELKFPYSTLQYIVLIGLQ